jgi:transposase-like protein
VPSRISRNASTRSKRPRIAPGVRAEVERRLRAGVSYREIAAHFGIADGSVRKIKKKMSEVALEPELSADAPALPSAVVETDATADASALLDGMALEGDLKSLVRRLIAEALKTAKMATEDKNASAAAKALRDAIGALPGLIRLEKAEAENVDAVSIPRDKIDPLVEAIYGRARTLATVETCPHCGRELRMAAVGAARESETRS